MRNGRCSARSTLSQKAGVPVHLLPRLVLKELADNALDAGGTVHVGQLDAGGWYVEDDGPGNCPIRLAFSGVAERNVPF